MPNIPRPSTKEVKKYLKRWDTLGSYVLQESALRKLFKETYPLNNDIDKILIKVASLNDFYSTNIFNTFSVAKNILQQDVDKAIGERDLSIVKRIANVTMSNDKKRTFYSFATKYISHHKPEIFPIFDEFIKKVLNHWKKEDKFYRFTNEDLRNYEKFNTILAQFKKFYGLKNFSAKDLDKYLWQLGKVYFPKTY